jgi:hypothetical protein
VGSFDKLRKADLIALLEHYVSGLARGRQKGADVQRLAAALRRSAIERAATDLLSNPETARWRTDAIVDFIFERQRAIGIRTLYARTTLDRIVRHSIARARARNKQSAA